MAAKHRHCIWGFVLEIYGVCSIYIYIYIIYTPNLGLAIAALGLRREHRGSTEGARGAEGVSREQWGAPREQKRAVREQEGERTFWLPVLDGAQQVGA